MYFIYKDYILQQKYKIKLMSLHFLFFAYKELPGDYCESDIPDPIPNSEVKTFCADGTLS